jgi:hypothetical protein
LHFQLILFSYILHQRLIIPEQAINFITGIDLQVSIPCLLLDVLVAGFHKNYWHTFLFPSSKRVMNKRSKPGLLKRKGYLWVTLILFIISISLHWIFGWYAFKQEQFEHGQAIIVSDYIVEMMRDTMENWQSEFLQLIWQVAGLAFLWYTGSPQSKEGSDRLEEKIDFLINRLDPENSALFIKKLEEKFPKN